VYKDSIEKNGFKQQADDWLTIQIAYSSHFATIMVEKITKNEQNKITTFVI